MPQKQLSETGTRAVASFAEARTLAESREAIQHLIRLKEVDAARTEPAFAQPLLRLGSEAAATNPEERAEAIALAFRIAAVAKGARQTISRNFRDALTQPIATAQLLPDAKDREYLAQALSQASGDWLVSYLGREAVLEESGERARGALITALLIKADSLVSVIDALAGGFRNWTPRTADVPGSRARRLQRVIRALRVALLRSALPVGTELGTSLGSLLSSAIERVHPPSRSALISSASEFLETLIEVIRLHFSLATEHETYAVVLQIKRLFLPSGWPDRLRNSLRPLASQLEEAIILLGKQGIVDEELRKVLEMLVDAPYAKRRLMDLADNVAGLNPSVRNWFASGGEALRFRRTPLAEESQLIDADRRIAMIYREALAIMRGISRDDGAHAVAPGATRRLVELVTELAAHRKLQVRGEQGDRVQYSPSEHDLGERPLGSRLVRIVRPMVEREAVPGVRQVILPAEVEPA
jgi:hypothetical protein